MLSTPLSFLGLYRDSVAEITSLLRLAHRGSLFRRNIPCRCAWWGAPSDISRRKPLRLILNQIGRRLTEPSDGSD